VPCPPGVPNACIDSSNKHTTALRLRLPPLPTLPPLLTLPPLPTLPPRPRRHADSLADPPCWPCRLYEVNSNNPQPLISYDGHTGNVTSVGFQKDGKWMYTGSEDGTGGCCRGLLPDWCSCGCTAAASIAAVSGQHSKPAIALPT
jgi:hypothetical protein